MLPSDPWSLERAAPRKKMTPGVQGGQPKDPRLLLGCEIEPMGGNFEGIGLDMLEKKVVHSGISSAADRSTQNNLEGSMAADRGVTKASFSPQ